MAKKVTAQVKLQIPAAKATPAPPVGTALGPQGVNIMDFCKAFNAKTSAKDQEGLIIPVVITIFSDRTFTFITKTPPAPRPAMPHAYPGIFSEHRPLRKLHQLAAGPSRHFPRPRGLPREGKSLFDRGGPDRRDDSNQSLRLLPRALRREIPVHL